MAENSKIEWCDHTFNPWVGCQPVSPGCDNCYAAAINKRFGHDNFGPGKDRRRTSPANWKLPLKWNRRSEIKFDAWEKFKEMHPGLTDDELQSRGFIMPTRPKVFCASMADVFDNAVPTKWRKDLFNLIFSTPYLDWLLLTKRISNVAPMIDEILSGSMKALPQDHPIAWPWPHVWIGITVCNQAEADRDIPRLLQTPAAKHFISAEPILGPIDLNADNGLHGGPGQLDWVIAGGETGHHARMPNPQWVRSLQARCAAAGVPFFFKGWGDFLPDQQNPNFENRHLLPADYSGGIRVGKKKAGHLLDGVEYVEVPCQETIT